MEGERGDLALTLGQYRFGTFAAYYSARVSDLVNQASEALSPICMRISLAVPIASSTLLTTWVARERLVSSAAFFSRSSAWARMMPSWLFSW